MLSRIAESLFWIGRYVERAEDTARILDVQMQLLIEDAALDEDSTCRSLLNVMGVEHEGPADRYVVLRALSYSPEAPGSIASALAAARESARRSRETVATEMWQALNTTYNHIQAGRYRKMPTASAFAWVRERAAMINGIAEATMSRDQGWQFMILGRSLERADMTARMVSAASLASGPTTAWSTTLRACGAHEAFLRTHRGLEADREAAEFLLLDRLFPRSIIHALNRAERCLQSLEPVGSRVGFFDEAQRLVGRARAELEYRRLTDIVEHLPAEMERVQRTCSAASDAVRARYFAGAVALTWTGERL
jgi:uncharacterized alpha-E superfamily protein